MPASITCYGAVGEIGGNKFLLEDGGARILLDFGESFGRVGAFYNELLRPRAARGLLDPLRLGLLPPLEGLYRKDLEIPGVWEGVRSNRLWRSLARDGQPPVDAVLLSHAHLDHTGDVSFLSGDIPVICSRTTAAISRAMQVTGMASMEREMVYLNPRVDKNGLLGAGDAYRLRPHRFLEGELQSAGESFWLKAGSGSRKGIEPASFGAFSGEVAGLPVKWWPVDHSIPGACGFAVHTTAGWIAYTGDIRFHGAQAELTRRFAKELAALAPAVLLCEGTHLAPDAARTTEADILERVVALLGQYRGKLAIADFGARNVERLLVFLEAARQSGRRLLLQPKDIYLLQALHWMDPAAHPSPLSHASLALYDDPKAAPRPWELELRAAWPADLTISSHQISEHPGDCILADSLWDLNDLPDLKGIAGGVYLFSNSRAYDDEQAADLDRLRNWVRWIGLDLVGDPDDPSTPRLHASGHASGEELAAFARSVQPATLVPIHTEDPDWWNSALAGSPIQILSPEEGLPFTIR